MVIKTICLLVFLAWAAYIDRKEYRIPNQVIKSALACRAILCLLEVAMLYRTPMVLWDMYLSELFAGIIVLVVAIVFRTFASKMIGAGDFKLLLVIALFLGLDAFFLSLVYSSAVALIVIVYLFLFKKINKNHAIPLAPILASGVVVFFIFQT